MLLENVLLNKHLHLKKTNEDLINIALDIEKARYQRMTGMKYNDVENEPIEWVRFALMLNSIDEQQNRNKGIG